MTDRRQLIALGALTAVALALRLVGLTRVELFVDEAATWWFAKLIAAGGLSEQMRLEPTPPLYYALVGLMTKLFGDGDFVLRLPSALFGAAAIPIVFALGRALFHARVGWISALLLTFHPLHVFYSREARVYPLLLCLTMLTLLALWRALDSDSTRAWVLFGAALLAVCYSHFYGMFLAFTTSVIILLWGRDGASRLRGLLAVACVGLGFAPYLLLTLPHLKASGAAWSIESFRRDYPEEQRIGRVLETQLIGADYHPYLRHLDRPPTPGPLRAASLLAQLILIASALGLATGDGRLRELGFLTASWLVPILVPWAITQFGRAIFHAGRHDVYALGGLCVLLAVGLDALHRPWQGSPGGGQVGGSPGGGRVGGSPGGGQVEGSPGGGQVEGSPGGGQVEGSPGGGQVKGLRRWLAVAVVATVAAGAIFRLAALVVAPGPQRHRPAGEWIARHAGPQDRVLAMGIRRLATEHYARLGGNPVTLESFPASTDGHPGWSDVMTLMEDQAALNGEARDRIAQLGREMTSRDTLFLLMRKYERTQGAVSATWLVDRHVLENLWHAGWQRDAELSSVADQIEAYRPPGPAADPSEDDFPNGETENR